MSYSKAIPKIAQANLGLPVKQLLKHNGNGMFVTLASWLAQLMPLPLEKGR